MELERLTMGVREAATLLGISPAHAYESIRLGRLPAVRLGRRLLVPRKALDEFLADEVRRAEVRSPRASDRVDRSSSLPPPTVRRGS